MNEIDHPAVAHGSLALLKKLLARVLKYPFGSLSVVLLMIVDVAFNTALSLSLQFLIDYAILPKNAAVLRIVVAALVTGFILSTGAQIMRDYLYARLGARVLDDLRRELLERLGLLSPGYFANAKVGDLLARFSTDLGAVETAVVSGFPWSLYAILHIVFGLVALVELEWRLTLFVLLGLSLCLIGPRLLSAHALKASYKFRVEQAAMISAIEERINAQRVVRSFMLNERAGKAIGGRSNHVAALQSRFNFLGSMVERSPNIVMLGFVVTIIAVGGAMAFDGAISIGALVSFNALFLSIGNYVESLTAAAPSLLHAAGGMRRIDEILRESPMIVESAAARPLPRLCKAIAFEKVSFGYAQDDRILSDLTLEIPCGEKVAFVGRSGSGKSTIVNLLLRFYDPVRGRVLFDGVDLREAQLATLYRQIGVVFQEDILFNTSVRENILMGALGASGSDVERAASAAELDEASLGPVGFDTIVGERGGRLSGGQRQRIAIARALIRDPSIFIFDEATSSLDPPTAAAINGLIERVTANRTVISITHRLEDVIRYDRIFVLERGRLVGEGRHEELLERCKVYGALWHKSHPRPRKTTR